MKLHLPKALLTATLAASCIVGSHALSTPLTGTYTATCSDNPTLLHNYTFTLDGSTTTAGWTTAAANDSEAILHFTEGSCTTADTVAGVAYDTFSAGGFIVDADTNVAGIGVASRSRNFVLGHAGKTSSSQINRNFKLSPNNGLTLAGTQTWTVATSATFSLEDSADQKTHGVSLNGSLTLNGSGNVDFTSQTLSGSAGSSVTVSSGTLKRATVNNIEVTVNGGTLSTVTMASGSTLVLGTNGTLSGVTMLSGSVLDLTGRTASVDTPLVSSSAVTISEGVTISLSDVTEGSTVKISDTTLNNVNFIIDGEEVAAARSSITQENGTYTFTSIGNVYSDMVWAGGASGTWNTTEANWTSEASGSAVPIAFANKDSVTFNTSAEVTIAEDVTVGSMTVSGEGTTVTLNNASTGNLIVGSSLAIEDGAKLVLSKQATDIGRVQGAVTVQQGGTLSVSGASANTANSLTELTGGVTFYNGSSLELGNGAAVNTALTIHDPDTSSISLSVARGATATWGIAQTGKGVTSVTVNEGATLNVTSNEAQASVFNNKEGSNMTIDLKAGSKLTSNNLFGWDNTAAGDSARTLNVGKDATWSINANTTFYLNKTTINLSGGKLVLNEGVKMLFERRTNSINTTADAEKMSVITGSGTIQSGNNGVEEAGYTVNVVRGGFVLDETNTADLKIDVTFVDGETRHAIQKTGAGTLELTKSSSSFTHNFYLRDGTTKLTGEGTLGGNDGSKNLVEVNAPATLEICHGNAINSNITLDGKLTLRQAMNLAGSLTVNSGATFDFSALQADGTGFTTAFTGTGTVDLAALNSALITNRVTISQQATAGSHFVFYKVGSSTGFSAVQDLNWASGTTSWDANTTYQGGQTRDDAAWVTFNTGNTETVSMTGNLNMNSLVKSGTTLDLTTDTHTYTGALSLEDGSTLRLTGTGLGLTQISGAGNVEIQNATTVTLTGDKVMKLEGDLIVKGRSTLELTKSTDATKKTTVDFSSLKSLVLDNSTLKANTNGASEGAYRQFTLGTLAVAGESEIAIDGSIPYHGYVTIGNLINEEGTGARTLTLSSTAKIDTRSIFDLNGAELNDGDSPFEGTIKVEQKQDRAGGKTALNLKHGTVASNAVIELAVSSNRGSAALGIAADEVTVKGITGDKKAGTNLYILSGEQAKEVNVPFAGDGRDRTLIIATGDNDRYSTTATLGDHLNLTKQGKGSQTFAGGIPDAIGTVKVEGGELAFSNAVALTITDLTVKSGATLRIGSSPVQALAEGGSSLVQTFAADAAPATGVRATGTVLLEGGSSVVGGGLNLTGTQTLEINDIGNGTTITLGGALILPTGGSITLTGDILDTLAGLAKGDTLNVFSGVTSLTLGDSDYTGVLEAAEATDLTNYFRGLGIGYQLGYRGAADGGVVYIQKNVPEPTTATLGLLALAALAARRRRKD